MSDVSQGREWWQASDLKWYPPEQHSNYEAPPPPGRPPVEQPRPADRPPTETATPAPRSGQRPRRQLKVALIAAIVVIVAAAIVITRQQHENSNSSQHREPTYGPQVTLPFTGLNSPDGVAVDTTGNLDAVDSGNNRVLKLPAGWASSKSTSWWISVRS